VRRELTTLVWDWNGTLLDDVHACVEAINVMLAERGLATVDIVRYRDAFRFPVREYYRRIGFDLTREDWDAVCSRYHNLYAAASKASPLRPGTVEALRLLGGEGYDMFVLSASELSILTRAVAERGVTDFFAGMYGLSNLHAHSKAGLGIELMSGRNHGPGSVLLIGDTTHDWEVAREMGCDCVLMTGGHESEERLLKCGCPLVGGMPELVDMCLGRSERE
jgi:phosphoglycolate phosphatase